MAKYPSQIDTSVSLPTAVDNLTPVQGAIFNRLRDAVIAIEHELGVKPSASYSTVRARIDALETAVGNLQIIELSGDLGGTLETPKIIGIQGFPVSDAEPVLNQILAWNGIAWTPSTSVISSTPRTVLISDLSGTILSGEYLDVNVSVPGTSIGDLCGAYMTSTSAATWLNIEISIRATFSDIVRVRFKNTGLSSAVITPGSLTYYVQSTSHNNI